MQTHSIPHSVVVEKLIYNFKGQPRNVFLYKADCMDVLDKLENGLIDIITTDPAYSGMNRHLKLGNGRIVGHYNNAESTNDWFKEFEDNEENYKIFLEKCKNKMSKNGHIYIMFDSYSLISLGNVFRNIFDLKNIIVWDKINIGMGHYYRRRHEFILFGTNGNSRKISNKSTADIWEFKRVYKNSYPTEKPIELFSEMIRNSYLDGCWVLDPFMGSGSSAVASVLLGCNYIGIDISSDAFNLAKTRVTNLIKQPLLYDGIL